MIRFIIILLKNSDMKEPSEKYSNKNH